MSEAYLLVTVVGKHGRAAEASSGHSFTQTVRAKMFSLKFGRLKNRYGYSAVLPKPHALPKSYLPTVDVERSGNYREVRLFQGLVCESNCSKGKDDEQHTEGDICAFSVFFGAESAFFIHINFGSMV